MILRVEEIPRSELHLVPITDLRQQIQQDREDLSEHGERELPRHIRAGDFHRRLIPAV